MTRSTPPHPGVADLPGLGPTSAAQLARLGVRDVATLRARDAFELFAQLKSAAPNTSLNMLYALIGAQEGVDWRVITRERRSELLTELDTRRNLSKRTDP